MKGIAQEIRTAVQDTAKVLPTLNREEIAFKKSPASWSKKEILGHLIDSAANNHQRFVRAVYGAALDYPTYNQNEWVRIQRYYDSPWESLITLWSAYNLHLSDLIERIPEEAKLSPCNIGKKAPVTLEFIVRDYLRHLRHHIEQILTPF